MLSSEFTAQSDVPSCVCSGGLHIIRKRRSTGVHAQKLEKGLLGRMTYNSGSGLARSLFGLGSSGISVSELLDEMIIVDLLGLFRVHGGKPPAGSSDAPSPPSWRKMPLPPRRRPRRPPPFRRKPVKPQTLGDHESRPPGLSSSSPPPWEDRAHRASAREASPTPPRCLPQGVAPGS